jgi:uncharacterized OsmC-like protein
MEVTIQPRRDVKFEASARGHRVICDPPAGNGGSDAGMTPPEYLLASWGGAPGSTLHAPAIETVVSTPRDGAGAAVSGHE